MDRNTSKGLRERQTQFAAFCVDSYVFDIASALFCGLLVGALFCLAKGDGPVHFTDCKKDFLVSLIAYLGVAVLWRFSASRSLRRMIPSWPITAILGTLCYWAYSTASTSTIMWKALPSPKPSITSFVQAEIETTLKLWFVFSFLTLGVAAVVFHLKYVPALMLRMWSYHEDQNNNRIKN